MAIQHSFAAVPKAQLPRSSFDRSFRHLTTFNEGLLIPVYCEEILPGDTVNCNVSAVVRLLSPLQVPLMDDLICDFHFFFVPNRLVWEHWQAFNGEQANPGDSTDFVVPSLQFPSTATELQKALFCIPTAHSIFDYFGVPPLQNMFYRTSATSNSYGWDISSKSGKNDFVFPHVNSLPFRAYNLIWNEWFRDENLQDRSPQFVGDGPDLTVLQDSSGAVSYLTGSDGKASNQYVPTFQLLPRGKRHDYFTSCLPWPQKGPGVEVTIGEVYGTGLSLSLTDGTNLFGLHNGISDNLREVIFGSNALGASVGSSVGSATGSVSGHIALGVPTREQLVEGSVGSGLRTDAITINDLRQAFQLQRLYERDARGGTRYIEILRAHFGVVSPDARLQRPEYLGGFSQPLQAVNVAQTSGTTDTSALGDLSSYIVSSFGRSGFVKSFVEHGFVIGLASVRSTLTYSQGLNRMWSRKTRFDYYWPALAHLGEQAVLNKEIFMQSDGFNGSTGEPINSEVFGYQERWSEYRYSPARISGTVRPLNIEVSDSSGARVSLLANNRLSIPSTQSIVSTGGTVSSLSYWTLSQVLGEFSTTSDDEEATPPALSKEFIVEQPPVNRAVTVPSESHFIADILFSQKFARVMPTYSVPGLIDHF